VKVEIPASLSLRDVLEAVTSLGFDVNKGACGAIMKEQAMQRLVETRIEIDEKVTAGEKLPETMIVYTMDADHLVISAKPVKALEDKALTKTSVRVVSQQGKYVVMLPPRIYNFYHLDENDYTIMASDKDPTTIIIAI